MRHNKNITPTETSLDTVLWSIVAAVCCYVLSACTGPMGMVLGGSEIHQKYNERIALSESVERRAR